MSLLDVTVAGVSWSHITPIVKNLREMKEHMLACAQLFSILSSVRNPLPREWCHPQ